MNRFVDILLFRRMVAPVILQVLFWAGIGGTLYGAWVLIPTVDIIASYDRH